MCIKPVQMALFLLLRYVWPKGQMGVGCDPKKTYTVWPQLSFFPHASSKESKCVSWVYVPSWSYAESQSIWSRMGYKVNLDMGGKHQNNFSHKLYTELLVFTRPSLQKKSESRSTPHFRGTILFNSKHDTLDVFHSYFDFNRSTRWNLTSQEGSIYSFRFMT